MKIEEKDIKGVYEIQLEPHEDKRGFFVRVYDNKIFKKLGIDNKWVQENHSLSLEKGTIRGLHFQYPPVCEAKLMRAVTGEMFFAVVDLRKNSRTFGKWISVIVSAKKKNMLLIPRGCANGMCTLTDNCNLLYKVDNYYSPNSEGVIKWNDLDIGIQWPVKVPNVISEKDLNGKSFKDFVKNYGSIEI